MIQDTPNLPSIKTPNFPVMFTINNTEGVPRVRMFNNGRIEILTDDPSQLEAAAKNFWDTISKQALKHEEVQLRKDLSFLIQFMESKGVIFCNPSEKIELSAWIGEIKRRYGV